jgi:hypothetical protein
VNLTVVRPETRTLGEIAESIRSHWSATEEDRFAIGRDLLDARQQFIGDREFGQWMKVEAFPFSQQWGHTLRLAAENEPAVRDVLTSQLVSGKKPNIETAVKAVLHPEEIAKEVTSETVEKPTEEVAFRDLLRLLGEIEALRSIDAGFAAIVPERRQASTAKRLRKAGSILARLAFGIEGTDWK